MCKYCDFYGSYSTEKPLLLNHYDKSEAIGAMGANIQLDFDGGTRYCNVGKYPQMRLSRRF